MRSKSSPGASTPLHKTTGGGIGACARRSRVTWGREPLQAIAADWTSGSQPDLWAHARLPPSRARRRRPHRGSRAGVRKERAGRSDRERRSRLRLRTALAQSAPLSVQRVVGRQHVPHSDIAVGHPTWPERARTSSRPKVLSVWQTANTERVQDGYTSVSTNGPARALPTPPQPPIFGLERHDKPFGATRGGPLRWTASRA